MVQQERPTPTDLAAALLRAWLHGDSHRLESEINRSSSAPDAPEDSFYGEQHALLGAIARRMHRCPDPFAAPAQDPALDVCIDLLFHLVKQDGGRAEQARFHELPYAPRPAAPHGLGILSIRL